MRGITPSPKELQTLYLQSKTPFGKFEQLLRASLHTNQVNVVTDPKQAPIILHIISTKLDQSVGAVSSNLQTPCLSQTKVEKTLVDNKIGSRQQASHNE